MTNSGSYDAPVAPRSWGHHDQALGVFDRPGVDRERLGPVRLGRQSHEVAPVCVLVSSDGGNVYAVGPLVYLAPSS
jgi:hypothetical protein